MNRMWKICGISILAISLFVGFKISRAESDSRLSIPIAPTQPGIVLVRFKEGASEAQKTVVRLRIGGRTLAKYSLVPGLEILSVGKDNSDVPQVIRVLEGSAIVEYAEPDYQIHINGIPNDPYFSNQWNLAVINAPSAWDTTSGSSNEVIAVVDSGIDLTHPDLVVNLWHNPGEIIGNGLDDDQNGYIDDMNGWDFAYNDNAPQDIIGHGTHVAGILGAAGNNGIGIAGLNWQVRLMPLRIFDDTGTGYVSRAIAALDYAVAKGAKISNNSWGGYAYTQSLYDAIQVAQASGHLYVASAGNDAGNNDSNPFYPASYNLDNVISVAASDPADNLNIYSNYGAVSVDLAAPGENILSTYPGGYGTNSGSSMAAAHVSGVVALVYGLHPDWYYSQVREAILGNARPVPVLSGKLVIPGILDAAGAVNAAAPPTPTPTPAPTFTPTPTAAPPTPTPNNFSHIGALYGIGIGSLGSKWTAQVTMVVHDGLHNPLANATVIGNWANGAKGSSSCVTDATGMCTVSKGKLSNKLVGVTFTVTNISHTDKIYNSGENEFNPPTVSIYTP